MEGIKQEMTDDFKNNPSFTFSNGNLDIWNNSLTKNN